MKKTLTNVALSILCAGFVAGCIQDPTIVPVSKEFSTTANTYTQQCVENKTLTVGASYKLNNNMWGSSTNGSGWQCVWHKSSNGKWGVNANHISGTAQNIKSYPALVRGWIWYNSTGSIWASPTDTSFPVPLSQIKTFTSGWTVTVPSNGEKYNTAYDIWVDQSNNPNHKAQYEIMIWINYKGPAYNGSDFQPIGTKIGSNVRVAGHNWDIYEGWNGTNNVFTFRRTTNTNSVNNLDLRTLLNYAQNQGFIESNYYVLGIQAGWEIVSGGAFQTDSYWSYLEKF